MYKHTLTLALLIMAGFLMWVRTYASPTSTASSARMVLLVLALGLIASAIANIRSDT